MVYNHNRPLSSFQETIDLLISKNYKPIAVTQMYFEDTIVFETDDEANRAFSELEQNGKTQAWWYGKDAFKSTVADYELNNDKVLIYWLDNLEESFITELRSNGVELSDDVVCRIYDSVIRIRLDTFGSDIELYAIYYDEEISLGNKENRILFGASGSFDPSDKASYWRTIHAASILKNWDIVCKLVNDYCKLKRKK